MKGSQAAIAAIVIVVVAAAVVALYRGGYGPGQPTQQPGENQVNIQGFAFIPSSITVSAGTTITWKNLDSAVHDVTSTGGPASFYSGNLSQGQTWQFTFENAGTYTYKCSIHPSMTGTVTVQ